MKFILSLDGGGTRLIIAYTFLQDLEKMLLEEGKGQVSDLFDMFVGSSAGGIMALMLGSGKCLTNCGPILTLTNLRRMMNKSLWDRILPVQIEPKYDGKGLKTTINQALDEIKLSECVKSTHVVTYEITKGKPKIFSSTKDTIPIRTLAMMTSAAPIYFPCVRNDSNKAWFIDGGVVANNPSLIGYTKAMKQWPGEEIRILSVGTGFERLKINGEYASHWGAFRWISASILDITLVGPAQMSHQLCKELLSSNYLRINSSLGEIPDKLDDTSEEVYEKCVALGHKWFKENKQKLRTFFDL
jgi:hypothetical protein